MTTEMQFSVEICTREIFDRLGLPTYLLQDKDLNPLGRQTVMSYVHAAVLIAHPIHHSEHPDQKFSLYVQGVHHSAWLYVLDTKTGTRLEPSFPSGTPLDARQDLIKLWRNALEASSLWVAPMEILDKKFRPFGYGFVMPYPVELTRSASSSWKFSPRVFGIFIISMWAWMIVQWLIDHRYGRVASSAFLSLHLL